jgi:crossover junction endodeoxyribonuclease RuvC
MTLETLLFSKNVKTAMVVSEVRGILILTAIQNGLPLKELTPLQIKTAVTGYGKADKKQMQNAVKMLFCLPEIPKPDDVADAIGIALSGIVKA